MANPKPHTALDREDFEAYCSRDVSDRPCQDFDAIETHDWWPAQMLRQFDPVGAASYCHRCGWHRDAHPIVVMKDRA